MALSAGLTGFLLLSLAALPRETVRSRFARSPSLAHLERAWSTQKEWKEPADVALVEAANAEEEVIHTARFREDFGAHFPSGCLAGREVWEEVESFTAPR